MMKIISNSVEVLQSVTESERKNGAMNVNLDNGPNLPTEKAIGIN